MKDYYLDTRLQEKMLRDKKITRAQVAEHIASLQDVSNKAVEYDDEGNPTNIPKRELKTLPVKPGEPEPVVHEHFTPNDPLSDAWGEGPR